ncbi:MAG: translational GTPase TypA [Clostridia bacterium]|nr:translational GTPase TypA [Clostridia bacterium]
MNAEYIRNIAIIAHVDHGKTTLVDKMLMQAGAFRENAQVQDRVMDSNDLEREKGITILAKNTSIRYNDYTVNIVDTPGHADFGGEVERIMKMVNGVLLLVDALEGCMPQTRFVLKKALEQKLKPLVVINKMDRDNARPEVIVDQVLDLFIELGAPEELLDFPIIYASAIKGWASANPDDEGANLEPLFKAIIEHIPAPGGDTDGPLQMQVTLLDYSDYLGRIGIGRVQRGTVKNGAQVALINSSGAVTVSRISRLFGFAGLNRINIEEAGIGEIVAVAGLGEFNVGDTITDPESPEALPYLKIDEPTIQMSFLVNDSPFAGQDGDPVTSRKLSARLFKEVETDVSLRVEETDKPEVFLVSGRGELHLAILIEKMRREGLEFQVSKPQVIYRDIDGVRHEPYEYLVVETPEEYVGPVMEKLGERRGEMVNMHNESGQIRLEYSIPARGLVGFRTEFLTDTRGYGTMNHVFEAYKPVKADAPNKRKNGSLVAWETGVTTMYGLVSAEERGAMFIGPGVNVYEGMIVGENSREQEIVVNVCKEKALTNMRSSTKDDTVKLKANLTLSLEQSVEFLGDHDYLEVTPKNLRLRKKYLKKADREKYMKTQPQ